MPDSRKMITHDLGDFVSKGFVDGGQSVFPVGQILLGGNCRVAQAEIQVFKRTQIARLPFNDLVKLVGHILVEFPVGVAFTQAQGLFVLSQPRDKIHATRAGPLFA